MCLQVSIYVLEYCKVCAVNLLSASTVTPGIFQHLTGMKSKLIVLAMTALLPIAVQAQKPAKTTTADVYTTDIDHFWVAYDAARRTSDTTEQQQIMQSMYIDKGSDGLKAFMKLRDYDAALYVKLINKAPRFWNSIRPNTLTVKSQAPAIERSISKLKKLYPEMRPAKMYFTIGGLRSGGTVMGDKVLVGAEIATGDEKTEASELSAWLQDVFKNQKSDNLVGLNIHEYIHTQQKPNGTTLLSQSIREGSADFISELVTGELLNSSYAIYGRANESKLKAEFKIDMFSEGMSRWLYNGSDADRADLGYFMGYSICKSYYNNATNKKKAIKDIIEVDYGDSTAVYNFLLRSKYYPEVLDQTALLKQYDALQPVVASLTPALDGRTDVDTATKTVTIHFSQPMAKKISISFGESGRSHFPITEVVGFSDDMKSLTLRLSMVANHDYEFLITGKSFQSQQGYALKEYPVKFRTK